MTFKDEEFEQQLREFKPRAATPLPFTSVSYRRTIRLVAATLALCAIGIVGVIALKPSREVFDPPLSSEKLNYPPVRVSDWNAAVRADKLDSALSHSADAALPATNQPDTALHLLAKE